MVFLKWFRGVAQERDKDPKALAFALVALTRPSTATAFSLRLRLHYKAARVGGVMQK